MPSVAELESFLAAFAPPELAESWDNVGLLVGDRRRDARRVMTCLTITPSTAAEAVRGQADLIVSHHPLPFAPLKRLTTDSTTGRILLDLIGANIAVYSPHTAFDSAAAGINARLAEGMGLSDVAPLIPQAEGPLGSGRLGHVKPAAPLGELAKRVKRFLELDNVQCVGAADTPIKKVGICCGSGGELMPAALEQSCDCFVTGEMRFHSCLEAEAQALCVILTGHYASERFAVEKLAEILAAQFADLEVWASRDERDPLRFC